MLKLSVALTAPNELDCMSTVIGILAGAWALVCSSSAA